MHESNSVGHTIDAHSMPTQDLIRNIGKDLKALADLEMRLARAEAKADMDAEIRSAKLGAIAAVCGLLGLNLLAVSIALSFAPQYAWIIAALMALLFFAAAAYAGWLCWNQLHKDPLGETRRSIKEDIEWIKAHIR